MRSTSSSRFGKRHARVLILALSIDELGGIERFNRALVVASERALIRPPTVVVRSRPEIDALGACRILGATPRLLSGRLPKLAWQFSYTLMSLVACLSRPSVIISTHVAVSPIGRYLSQLVAARHIVIAHGIEVPQHSQKWRKLASSNAQIYAVSEFTRHNVARASRTPIDNIMRIVLPVHDKFFSVQDRSLPVPTRFVSVARLTAANSYKGVDTLIRAVAQAAKQHNDLQVTVIGSGDLLESYRAQVRALRLGQNIQFVGKLTDGEMLDHFATAHAFVLPGRATEDGAEGEGFGMVFAEAAAAGLAVIAGSRGGSAEAVEDGVTGILVDGNDVAAVTQAMLLIAEDADLRSAYGRAGRIRAGAQYSTDLFEQRIAQMVAGRNAGVNNTERDLR